MVSGKRDIRTSGWFGVIAGLDPAIHILANGWTRGSSPRVTDESVGLSKRYHQERIDLARVEDHQAILEQEAAVRLDDPVEGAAAGEDRLLAFLHGPDHREVRLRLDFLGGRLHDPH